MATYLSDKDRVEMAARQGLKRDDLPPDTRRALAILAHELELMEGVSYTDEDLKEERLNG